MPKRSAGLLMFTLKNNELKVLLVHPGGPFFKNKDNGCWGIPKGLVESNENILDAAIREFEEETGIKTSGDYISLGEIRQNSGKIVHAWALEVEDDSLSEIKSNSFEMEWPPGSGRKQNFPEVDKCEFFTLEEAEKKINPSQIPLINNLKTHLNFND
jgi:predicted NUDIX family NTP pyrophosphohydrolase